MSTDRRQFKISGLRVEVIRKDIKNLHLGVYPPNGRVRVAAPLQMNDEAVRLAVISRLGWIRKRQKAFEDQERQSEREFVTGECHYFMGQRYRLDVVESKGRPGVSVRNRSIMELKVRPGSNRAKRAEVLDRWYRESLRDRARNLVAHWEPKAGVEVAEIRIKKMKTHWGTSNSVAGRIWLNLELAKKPPLCQEYIVVHEMIHFLERHHTERFRKVMDELMPDWRLRRDELNNAPLAHENWKY